MAEEGVKVIGALRRGDMVDGTPWYSFHCDEIPGLYLCSPDLAKLLADILPAWRKLHEVAPKQVPNPDAPASISNSGEKT